MTGGECLRQYLCGAGAIELVFFMVIFLISGLFCPIVIFHDTHVIDLKIEWAGVLVVDKEPNLRDLSLWYHRLSLLKVSLVLHIKA